MAYANEKGTKRAAWEKAHPEGDRPGYLGTTECKKLLLADLKAAAKDSKSPLFGCRITLREPHHKSFNVTIADAPFAIYTTTDHGTGSTHRGHYIADAFKGTPVLFYSVHALRAEQCVREISHAWNYDRYDIMTDYFDVGFYFDVTFNHEQSNAEKLAAMAAGGSGPARKAVGVENARAVLNDHRSARGAELLEADWNLEVTVVKACRVEFGEAFAATLQQGLEAAGVDAEKFDAEAAKAAGLAVVIAREDGAFQGDKAKKLNAAAKRAAKKAAAEQSKAIVDAAIADPIGAQVTA